jgi:hypothetical protein
MTISESFALLITRIQPLPAETKAAEQHLGTIKTRLQTVFDLVDCKRTGSYARSTSIRGYSDTDLFPVFRKSNFTRADTLISSDTALNNIDHKTWPADPKTRLPGRRYNDRHATAHWDFCSTRSTIWLRPPAFRTQVGSLWDFCTTGFAQLSGFLVACFFRICLGGTPLWTSILLPPRRPGRDGC